MAIGHGSFLEVQEYKIVKFHILQYFRFFPIYLIFKNINAELYLCKYAW